jgi:hypothetical protein
MLVCEKGLFYLVGVGLFCAFAFQMVRIVLNILFKNYWLRSRETVYFVDARPSIDKFRLRLFIPNLQL